MKTKILIDCIFFQHANSGIARVWNEIIKRLSRSNKVSIFILERGGSPFYENITYIPFPSYNFSNCPADSYLIEEICKLYEIDVFSSTYNTTPIETPIVLIIHDMIPELMSFNLNEIGWLEKEISINIANQIICVSENTKNDLIRFYPYVDKDRICVAHLGCDKNIVKSNNSTNNIFRKKYGINKKYFIIVGDRYQHNGYKNVELFFKCLNRLNNLDFSIVCVGGKSDLEDSLRCHVPDGISVYNIRLTDVELVAAYQGAIALIYPSLYEGFGLPVIEAMSCGCPVITTHNGSLREVASDAALIISGLSEDELIDAVKSVFDPNISNNLKKKGYQQSERFSWDTIYDMFLACCVRACNDSNINLKIIRENYKKYRQIQYSVNIN